MACRRPGRLGSARLAEALERRLLLSGPASLVADLNAVTLPSNATYYTRVGERLLFRADDGVHGNEWFVSDGTAAGTSLLKDVNPGPNGSLPAIRTPDVYLSQMAVVGDTLYFAADEGSSAGRAGVELWKTDGTPAGTVRVKDINPGAAGSSPQFLTALGGALYFSAGEPTGGTELWASDGTEQGTRRVADLAVPGSSLPVLLGGLNGRLLLAAQVGASGYELWSSDGTTEGTALLKDIYTGAGGSDPGYNSLTQLGERPEAVVAGGEMYFPARGREHGRELWKTDGTADGTVRVTDLPAINAEPRFLTEVSGTVYFVNYPFQAQGTPKTIYRVDVSLPGGLDPVGQIDWGNRHEAHLGAAGGKLFFAGPSQDKIGLFTHDPASPAGTPMSLVKALNFLGGTTATGMFADVGGVAYFRSHVNDLWRSDGTEAGTQQVFETRPARIADPDIAARWPVAVGPGDALYVTSEDPLTGAEPYRSDGTPGDGGRVVDLNTSTANGVTSAGAALPDGRLLFAGSDGLRGTELWVTDGTGAGTRLLREFAPGEPSGVSAGPLPVGTDTRLGAAFEGRVYFSAGGPEGRELWASDGTEAGTVLVKDINPGPNYSNPEEFTVFGGRLYFRAGANNDRELWSTDGTEAGTVRVRDIHTGGESVPRGLTVIGDTLYFAAYGSDSGREVWKTDGTEAGTVVAADVAIFSSDPELLTPWQGKLFFSAVTSGPGRELWVIDDGGTRLVRDLTPTVVNVNSQPTRLTAATGGLLFEAGLVNARDVYVTDGTFDNTVRLRDRAGDSAPALGTLTLLGAMDGWAYFFNVVPDAAPGTVRMELWKWDAGAAEPLKVATLLGPGSPLGSTQALGTADGFLYFRMQSPVGIELWRTDGTGAGTLMVQDLFPGAGHGSPGNFSTAGGRVYFTATDGTHGSELWSMPMRPAERAEPGVVYRGGAFGDAVAPDKAPLRPGGTASAANVSGYDRGINQIELALPGVLPAGVTADDFEFRVGRGGDPAGWAVAPAPLSVERVPWQAGADAARYRITWADGVIRNTWLRVTVKGSGRTGLRSADVFYFGSLPGETGDGPLASPAVGAADYAATRARLGRRATIGDVADHNRDGRVDVRDLAVVRRNYFSSLAPVADAAVAASARPVRRRGAWEGLAVDGLG